MFMLCSSYDPSTVRYSKNRDIIVDIKVIYLPYFTFITILLAFLSLAH